MRLIWLALAALCTACATPPDAPTVRFATFNAAMGLAGPGELAERLESGDDPALAALAGILQTIRPDVLLLNEFDYIPGVDAARLLQDHYLSVPQNGREPITYTWSFSAPVNTGVDSGLDLDGNGVLGDPADAWGFGLFPGQYGMLLLSRLPLEARHARTFQHFPWQAMPGARQPILPGRQPFYPSAIWARLRLSSTSHWDVPVRVGPAVVHMLLSHPTPPVFDGKEDRNGSRNHDEIRFWADYVQGDGYFRDDQGRAGGLPSGRAFVIAGDLNADPLDGDSVPGTIARLLEHPQINSACTPASDGAVEAARIQGGANTSQRGDPAFDTADFSDRITGNLRVDYVLPASQLTVTGCGVYWPAPGQPGHELISFSDHRLTWLDVVLQP
ncbi:MAG TPA: endonuclease/exonuclease/phosphatase family protein [Xanthomonadales bacterium]|nr:endonuclease/exonuclease/phosphatase family protein [Xanthomonadales bacterium]